MRNLIITLIPAALAACGNASAPAAEAPEASAKPPAQQAQAEKPEPKPATQITEAAGTWSRSGKSVVYAAADGAPLFSAKCLAASEDLGGPALELTSISSADEAAGSIDIFTSAGNARVDARPDKTPGTAFGVTDTVGQAPYVLAAGSGEIRIVSGTKGVTFETDQMLEDLIESCRPAYTPPADDEKGEEATDAEPEETPSGT